MMLGNIKEFLNVVQDGISSNNNLRQTLQEVQKVKNIFKEKLSTSTPESKVNYETGGAILAKYQEQWEMIHRDADNNAKSADDVDVLISELYEKTNAHLQSANELAKQLSQLPNLTAQVAQCVNSLKNVQSLLTSVEEDLLFFEDIIERDKMERWKLDHHYELALYKEKKMAALEETRTKLAQVTTSRQSEVEKKQLAELQARRENSAAAFQQDLAKYITSGVVPSAASSPAKITLDQVQLDNDPTDLEKFLES